MHPPSPVALSHLYQTSPPPPSAVQDIIYHVLLPSCEFPGIHTCVADSPWFGRFACTRGERRGGGRGEIRNSMGVSQYLYADAASVPANRIRQEKEIKGKPNCHCHRHMILQVENPLQVKD